MLIPCLEQLPESDAWHPLGSSHSTELHKPVGAELCPSYFHWIRVLEAVFSQQNPCIHTSAQHRCKHLGCHPQLEARQPGLGAVLSTGAGAGWHKQKGISQLQSLRIWWDPWLPLPMCVDISNVNMKPVNFHTLVTASPVSVEASKVPPPSWSCWESLDLWQLRLFLGHTLGCQMWDSGFIAASRREMSQAGGRFSLINPYHHPNLSATATENREPDW